MRNTTTSQFLKKVNIYCKDSTSTLAICCLPAPIKWRQVARLHGEAKPTFVYGLPSKKMKPFCTMQRQQQLARSLSLSF